MSCFSIPSATKRCHVCTEYRKTLHAMYHRRLNQENSMNSDRSNPDSHANYRYLNGSEKNDRLQQLHTKSRLLSQKMKRMLEKLESEIDIRVVYPCVQCLHSRVVLKGLVQNILRRDRKSM